MKSVRLSLVALVISSVVYAGEVDGSAVIGSAIGAAAGTAIGSAVGGKEGAVIGGGAGGAIGAAVGSSKESTRDGDSRVSVRERVIVVEEDERGDNGKHKGHYKKKHKHQHGRDD